MYVLLTTLCCRRSIVFKIPPLERSLHELGDKPPPYDSRFFLGCLQYVDGTIYQRHALGPRVRDWSTQSCPSFLIHV